MEMTKVDYEERKQRIADGEGTDEDRRLVKHYDREQAKQSDDSVPAWLLHDQPEEEDGDPEAGYSALSKRQLIAELSERKNADGQPLGYPSNGNKATLISILEENDRQAADVARRAELEQGQG